MSLIIIGTYYYQTKMIESLSSKLEDKSLKLKEANTNNKLIIEAYEQTIRLNDAIIKEKTIVTEAKEKVVVKYKTLIKEVEKRGEIKQDENSTFTIISF
jgi:hypothetical protein